MYKQILSLFAIIALSAVIVFFMLQSKQALEYLVSAHEWVANLLKEVFSGGNAGNISRNLVALLAIPMIAGLVPSLIFWLMRKRWFPYFMDIVWIVWLVQAGALIITASAA